MLVLLTLLPAAGLALAAPAGAPPGQEGNLLQNPGFESPYEKQCCQPEPEYPAGTPIDEVQVAAGWRGWWLPPDIDAAHPSRCDENSGGNCVAWHRPEWREAFCGEVCANRIRSGSNAQKYFTFFSVHDAGMYQQVGGITPGRRLRFSVYMQAWSASGQSTTSSGQASMGMRVGIDPFGGTNPFSPNVIWSPVRDTYDTWGLYTVEATARGGAVTVFTRSAPVWPLEHNDVYVDDASLVYVGGSAPAPTQTRNPGGSTAVAPTAVPPTAAPQSGFIYVVQPGDNYYRIARRFGVAVQAIYAANNVTNPNVLRVGTRLLIPGVAGPAPGGSPAPSPTRAPASPTVPPEQLPGAFTYVVQRGDNLYRLSVRFGVSIARIKQLNNLTQDIIYIGQRLVIAP